MLTARTPVHPHRVYDSRTEHMNFPAKLSATAAATSGDAPSIIPRSDGNGPNRQAISFTASWNIGICAHTELSTVVFFGWSRSMAHCPTVGDGQSVDIRFGVHNSLVSCIGGPFPQHLFEREFVKCALWTSSSQARRDVIVRCPMEDVRVIADGPVSCRRSEDQRCADLVGNESDRPRSF